MLSDHGMTNGGNHGGSSFEETDSLVMFIHLNGEAAVSASDKHDTVNQVCFSCLLICLMSLIYICFIYLNFMYELNLETEAVREPVLQPESSSS